MSHKKKYPIYGDDDKKLKPGLYLGLFHGFKDAKARVAADDWGANGPLIGPLKFVHTTYGFHIKFQFVNEKDAEKYGFRCGCDHDLFVAGRKSPDQDCVAFPWLHGMYYGDWTVFNIPEVK